MSPRHPRRFPRVTLPRIVAEGMSALEAYVTWPNLEISYIRDLGRMGLACGRPGIFPIAVHTHVKLQIHLGHMLPFEVKAQVAWYDAEYVGFYFDQLPSEGLNGFLTYFDSMMVGANMTSVDPAHFSKEDSFDVWLQAAGDVSVFIWKDKSGLIEKVHVRLAEETVVFTRSTTLGVLTNEQCRALLILSGIDKEDLPVEEFLGNLKPES